MNIKVAKGNKGAGAMDKKYNKILKTKTFNSQDVKLKAIVIVEKMKKLQKRLVIESLEGDDGERGTVIKNTILFSTLTRDKFDQTDKGYVLCNILFLYSPNGMDVYPITNNTNNKVIDKILLDELNKECFICYSGLNLHKIMCDECGYCICPDCYYQLHKNECGMCITKYNHKKAVSLIQQSDTYQERYMRENIGGVIANNMVSDDEFFKIRDLSIRLTLNKMLKKKLY